MTSSSGSRGGAEGAMAPPGPVKIGHKKDGHQRRPHRFHVSRPPLTRPLDPLLTSSSNSEELVSSSKLGNFNSSRRDRGFITCLISFQTAIFSSPSDVMFIRGHHYPQTKVATIDNYYVSPTLHNMALQTALL